MKYLRNIVLIAIAVGTQLSCKKLIEIDSPKNSIVQGSVFVSDDIATSAVTGIYYSMFTNGFASGNNSSITSICGLTSDEFETTNTNFSDFYDNQISPENTTVLNDLYSSPYSRIYAANLVLEGLGKSTGLTPSTKSQLRGEALFIRAFTYFYLVNLYGAVPLQLTSDYRVTQSARRATSAEIYSQIISDLKEAETLLTDTYITTERVRPNLSTAQAMLARVYLYNQDWTNSEKYASLVINKVAQYKLVNLDDVFLKNSLEAIWQLMPTSGQATGEGFLFILNAAPAATNVFLKSNFAISGFETNDKRRTSWVKSFSTSSITYYYPYKYKLRTSTSSNEYSMVLRLAEQYLIRSEARAQLNNLVGGIEDLDVLRSRAGISLFKDTKPGISKLDLLSAIQNERRVELFSEWGHRWFDLKRTATATQVLGSIKPKWQSTDVYFPIPQNEININRSITQNDGY